MQVMCIKNGTWVGRLSGPHKSGPSFGEVCHVFNSEVDSLTGMLFYELAEYPFNMKSGKPQSFVSTEFIPLSDIDEKNIIAERQKEKV